MISNSSGRLSSLQEIVTFLKQKNRHNIKNYLKYAGFCFSLVFLSLVQKSPRCILIKQIYVWEWLVSEQNRWSLLVSTARQTHEAQEEKTNLTEEFQEFIFCLPNANLFYVLLKKATRATRSIGRVSPCDTIKRLTYLFLWLPIIVDETYTNRDRWGCGSAHIFDSCG